MDNSSLQLEDPDPVNGFYGNPWLIAFLLIPFGITQTVGNGLLYGIIFYEKYGVDPQKRTLINMLVGQLCWSIIFLNIADYPIPTFRYFFGPYRKYQNLNIHLQAIIITVNIYQHYGCLTYSSWCPTVSSSS